jgi:uncharacterized membrane protein SpoIIM required for sporulation
VGAAVGMVEGVSPVRFTAVGVGFTAGLPGFMVGAVAGMAVGTMVAWPTWVMGGVVTAACIHTSLPII